LSDAETAKPDHHGQFSGCQTEPVLRRSRRKIKHSKTHQADQNGNSGEQTPFPAFLTAPKIGRDTLGAIRKARRELVEHDHAEAVFVQLPTSDPATPSVIAGLESDGFGLAGIALNFLPDSDLVRLVYLTDPLSMDAMQIEEPFAEELVRHALAARI
jgi:hypothetical protein